MAGPATEIAVASTFPPSFRHPLLIDGYMKSCVGGASGPNWPNCRGGRPSGAGPAQARCRCGFGQRSRCLRRRVRPQVRARLRRGAGAASGTGPRRWPG